MKTYDIYGSPPDPQAEASERWEYVRDVALQVQRHLGVPLLADGSEPHDLYRDRGAPQNENREVFVIGNVAGRDDPLLYPEFEHAVVVGVNEPTDHVLAQASLELMGLTLLRRRRRAYIAPQDPRSNPALEMYAAPTDAAGTVALLQATLRMELDGNEHAATGGDSHYCGESERFGTVLVFDNAPTPFGDAPFSKYPDVPAVLVVANSPNSQQLRRLLQNYGFTFLKASGSEADQ